jgi:hypothetical protein
MAPTSHDWQEWHRAYDRPDSALARRLAIVQGCIADALDAAPPGPIHVVGMCAGEGRDLLGVLRHHPRAGDVIGRLVELDPALAAVARANAPAAVDVLCADAGDLTSYEGAVPADLVLVCGVFGNITDDDIDRVVDTLPALCNPGATVMWTRHRRPPDRTHAIRARFTENGFEEVAFHTPDGTVMSVGVARFAGAPRPFRPPGRLFSFVGYRALADGSSGRDDSTGRDRLNRS